MTKAQEVAHAYAPSRLVTTKRNSVAKKRPTGSPLRPGDTVRLRGTQLWVKLNECDSTTRHWQLFLEGEATAQTMERISDHESDCFARNAFPQFFVKSEQDLDDAFNLMKTNC